jgi:hypothetical protein
VFAVATLVLRIVTDLAVPANMQFDSATNFVGGLVFAVASAVITTGIVVVSLTFTGSGPGLMGHQFATDESGQVRYENNLWVPVDRITVALYEQLSLGSFATDTPLALELPKVHEQGAIARLVFQGKGDGKATLGRFTMTPDDFSVVGRYTVQGPLDDLLTDANQPERAQLIRYPSGQSPSGAARIEGYVINFRPGAVEQSGQVVLGPGQIRLICASASGETVFPIHPMAIIAQPEAGAQTNYRFRLDASNLFIPSVGGVTSPTMGVEFLVPEGLTPKTLIVKNARVGVDGVATGLALESPADRDEMLAEGELFASLGASAGGGAGGAINAENARAVAPEAAGIENVSQLPRRWSITRGREGGLDIDRNNNNRITGGQHRFTLADLEERVPSRDLEVRQFATTEDTGIVQVTLADGATYTQAGFAIESAGQNDRLALIAENGELFSPVGFIYVDQAEAVIRFTPDRPITTPGQFPTQLSRSKQDQFLVLVFRVRANAQVAGLVVGDEQVLEFSPTVEVRSGRRR